MTNTYEITPDNRTDRIVSDLQSALRSLRSARNTSEVTVHYDAIDDVVGQLEYTLERITGKFPG